MRSEFIECLFLKSVGFRLLEYCYCVRGAILTVRRTWVERLLQMSEKAVPLQSS